MTFDRPEDAADEVNLNVTVDAGGASYTDSAFVSLGTAASAPDLVTSGRSLVGTPGMLLGALALALGFAGILAVAIAGPSKSSADRRIEAYFGQGASGQAKVGHQRRLQGFGRRSDGQGRVRRPRDPSLPAARRSRLRSDRVRSGCSSTRESPWGPLWLGFIVGGGGLAMLGLLLGAVGPWLYLKMRHSRRLNRFNGQLAETLGLMAGGLQAGLALPQAIDSVVREGNEPMAGELRRALVEQRLGVDITDALDSVGARMDSEDFAWIVLAIRIQREVGGNLAEILHTVSDTLREREYLRRQVRALSAEGRLSGYILTGLPPLVFGYMTFANPGYARVLYTTTVGYIILAVALFMLALGGFAMAKLATVKV